MKEKIIEHSCPHCKNKDAWSSRVQSSDELSWKTFVLFRTELWECNKCGGYFLIKFKIQKIVKLISEEDILGLDESIIKKQKITPLEFTDLSE